MRQQSNSYPHVTLPREKEPAKLVANEPQHQFQKQILNEPEYQLTPE